MAWQAFLSEKDVLPLLSTGFAAAHGSHQKYNTAYV